MIKVGVSIVVYQENEQTLQRVLNLLNDFNVVVFDNSNEDRLRKVCNYYDNVLYYFNNKNIGFGAGHNRAFSLLQEQKNDIYLVLNPDIFFNIEVLKYFLQWFYQSKGTALALPNILNEDGSVQHVVREVPTITSLIKRKLGLKTDEITIQKNSICEIPWAHGCFMAFKMDVFKKLGGFDEQFFMYMEDVDIWLRAKQYGKTVINTNFEIYHEHRRGSSKNIRLFYCHLVSAVKFFLKYK